MNDEDDGRGEEDEGRCLRTRLGWAGLGLDE